MKRRDFLFRSAKAATLLSPLLLTRRATANPRGPRRAFFMVLSSGYPDAEAFFPTGTERSFTLGPIMRGLEGLERHLVIVRGIDLPSSGPNPRNNNHVRSMGLVLTAKDVLTVSDREDADAGGPSIDQVIASDLGLGTVELMIHDEEYNHMRGRPFATGPRAFKRPIVTPGQAFDQLFRGVDPGEPPGTPGQVERRHRLLARRSMLDDLGVELRRLRQELDGAGRIQLDAHEDAIRRAEQSVARDLESTPSMAASPLACTPPSRTDPTSIPLRAEAHLDLLFAAFLCHRVQIGSVLMGYSGYHWRYEWVSGVSTDDIHDNVHHRASRYRDPYIRSSRWDWDRFGAFVKRLEETPEGAGTMLDNTLCVGTSNFGQHHHMGSVPFVLAGNAGGRLTTGRFVNLSSSVTNDKALTSIAHLMGDPIPGIGNDPRCGPLVELTR